MNLTDNLISNPRNQMVSGDGSSLPTSQKPKLSGQQSQSKPCSNCQGNEPYLARTCDGVPNFPNQSRDAGSMKLVDECSGVPNFPKSGKLEDFQRLTPKLHQLDRLPFECTGVPNFPELRKL